ncbi:hypothetical protein IL306_002888 [Fusarium sp. DS 682]|nr:hypothetical protein IL306_002888 [Fusarium sp. DS 682]
MSAKETAAAITKPVLDEQDPPSETYRLWGLLADALIELEKEREKLYNLLAVIQELGVQGPIDFSHLPGFGNMWADLNQSIVNGSMPWEKEDGIPDEEMTEMRHHYMAVGTIEATLYVRDIAGIPARWAWDTLNVVCLERPGLDAYIGRAYSWLSVAGEKLRSSMNPDEVVQFPRAVDGGRPGAQKGLSQSMSEHMGDWTYPLMQLKSHNSTLSDEGKRLAAECDKLLSAISC